MDGVAASVFSEAVEGPDATPSLTPNLNLDGFAGSLDFLLRVARAHQINLAALSIVDIVDQLAQALERAPAKMPLAQKADWVVMAAWIVLLRANLFLPADAPAQREAEVEAGQLRNRLMVLQEAQTLAAWLDRRPVLGRDVFARGCEEYPDGFGEVHHAQVDVIAFLWAAMELFDDPADQPDTVEIYRPAGANPYSIPEARLRILRLLAEAGQSQTLDRLLPEEIRNAQVNNQKIGMLRARAAVSTTFIAALELAKQGDVAMDQDAFLSPIRLRAFVEISAEEPL
jgi:segregation and condensation protein A